MADEEKTVNVNFPLPTKKYFRFKGLMTKLEARTWEELVDKILERFDNDASGKETPET